MKLNVVSYFDGMSCGQLSLRAFLGQKDFDYYSFEIDRPAMNVTNFRFPHTIQMGDVTKMNTKTLPRKTFLLMGGSPCTDLSVAGRKKGMITKTNIKLTSFEQYMNLKEDGFQFEGESFLFWELARAKRELNPEYFLMENVVITGENKIYEKVMNEELGLEPIRINSSLLTAQNRDRLYWTNIPNVTVPEDKGILLHHMITDAVGGYGARGVKKKGETKYSYPGSTRKDGKANCLTKSDRCRHYTDIFGEHHRLTVEACEVLQGVPIGYSDVVGVCKTDRYKMLGNGWTVPVIRHILSHIPQFQNIEMLKNYNFIEV